MEAVTPPHIPYFGMPLAASIGLQFYAKKFPNDLYTYCVYFAIVYFRTNWLFVPLELLQFLRIHLVVGLSCSLYIGKMLHHLDFRNVVASCFRVSKVITDTNFGVIRINWYSNPVGILAENWVNNSKYMP